MSAHVRIPMKPGTAPARAFTPAPFGTLQRKCACGGSGSSGGECEGCKEKKLQRNAAGSGPETAPPIVHEGLRSPGQPLDAKTRAFFEPRLGHDFSKVRIHSDPKANESARAVSANAYTVGNAIVFANRPSGFGDSAGLRLIAHELSHVVQQSGLSHSFGELRVGAADSAYEREADQVAKAVVSNQTAARPIHRTMPSVQRDPAPNAAQNPAPASTNLCQAQVTDPQDKVLWQSFFQQAIQGIGGNDQFKSTQAKANAACDVANTCMQLFPVHNEKVECAARAVQAAHPAPAPPNLKYPNPPDLKGGEVDAATKVRLALSLALNSDWGDSFRSALQSTTAKGFKSAVEPVNQAVAQADQLIRTTGNLDQDSWNKYMACPGGTLDVPKKGSKQ
jgi:Domain of unknown function (DUF4157)